MSDNRNVSENQFGNKAVVIQGNNFAPINAGFPEEDSPWLEKISRENPAYHKKRILEAKGPFLYESFRWILDHPDFNKWRNTEKSGIFWIKGDPGKGKTMLLGGLVDDFEKSPQVGINLAYFFCQATDSRINTAAAVIGGLTVSFIQQHHELRSYIRTKYKDDLDKLNGPDGWYILRDVFEKATQHSTLPNPICIVDALDECEQEDGRKQLLRLIIETSCRVKWLISSRNIPEIERELQAIDSSRRLSLELKENADYVTESVDLYIDNSIQNIVALKGDDELLVKATNTLKSKANGTFLWVALVIEQLRDTKHRNVEAVLDEIPEGLENLYSLILKRLAKQEDEDAYQVLLSTVTAAERPLHLEEILTFISFQWKRFKPTFTIHDIRDIVKDCGSFLSIRENTVYFIHQSVKDYMMGTAFKAIFPAGIEHQHYKMFTTSISAMSRILKYNMYDLKNGATLYKNVHIPPKSRYVTVWDDRGNIEIWSGESGERIRELQVKDNRFIDLSPNSELMACVQWNGGDVEICHVETGKSLHLLKGPDSIRYGLSSFVSTAFSDDSQYIVAGYPNGKFKVWCLESGKCLYENDCYDYNACTSVVFSPDSEYIATVSRGDSATVCIWDWRMGHCISQTKLESRSFVSSLAFSSDATVLIAICVSRTSYGSRCSYEVNVYDVISGACLSHVDIGESNYVPIFDPEKEHIVSDRFKLCKRSSWKHWDTIPQAAYYYISGGSQEPEYWVYFGEHKVFHIPKKLSANRIYFGGLINASGLQVPGPCFKRIWYKVS
ncbi:hypothetical protein MKX08_004655 [Trichoderma sp. CBMAI-0020]|nr:hypothetical protein MKX08_004655 [Trichoderma sp. CBMAI-0020]